jgi:3-hydroxy-9,10-secoandrosta-1,3,5(10)-triene-9,17-dione monooxygenase reductase component
MRTPVTDVHIEAGQFREVMANYPTGVSVITAVDADERPIGMVVGSFTSVSLDPPLVGFLPDKKSTSWPAIKAAGHFCVNVLGSDQADACQILASRRANKFDSIEHHRSPYNLPVISGSTVRIECRLHSVTDAGDHWFVLGRVLDMEACRDGDPLLFYRGQYGRFVERPYSLDCTSEIGKSRV